MSLKKSMFRVLRALGVGFLAGYGFLMLTYPRAEVSLGLDLKLDGGGFVDVYFAQGDAPFNEYRKTRFFTEPGVWQTHAKTWALVPPIRVLRIDADPRASALHVSNPQLVTRASTLISNVAEFWNRGQQVNHFSLAEQTADALSLAVGGPDPHIVFKLAPKDYTPATAWLREAAIAIGVVAALLWGFLIEPVWRRRRSF